MIPPSLAIAALPLIVALLCLTLNPRVAICVAIIGGYLFLPGRTGIDLPLLPAFNKFTIPGLVAFAVLAVRFRESQRADPDNTAAFSGILPGWLPRSPIGRILLVIVATSPFLTVLTNDDTLRFGDTVLRALRPHDAVAGLATTLVALLPLLLARKFLANEDGHRTLLIVLAVLGFAYSFLTAYEIRMSPQLNLHVYGFRGANWRQNLRSDGFRPFVFLHHGLWLAVFLACAALACMAAFRALQSGGQKTLYLLMGLWMLAVLALSRSFGAFLIVCALVPVILVLSVRLQLVLAAFLAGLVLLYPALRGTGAMPVDALVSRIAAIDAERAASLQFRVNNEEILLDKANERPLFGWGGWSRSRVFDENGNDISTTDGRWIIAVGESGWYGYIGTFGLMALPILTLALRRRRYEVSLATSGLCLVLIANMIDLLLNGTLTMVTWLIAGALLGRLEWGQARDPTADAAEGAETPPDSAPHPAAARAAGPPSYTRFPHSHVRASEKQA